MLSDHILAHTRDTAAKLVVLLGDFLIWQDGVTAHPNAHDAIASGIEVCEFLVEGIALCEESSNLDSQNRSWDWKQHAVFGAYAALNQKDRPKLEDLAEQALDVKDTLVAYAGADITLEKEDFQTAATFFRNLFWLLERGKE